MTDELDTNQLKSIRMVDRGAYRIPNTTPLLRRRELNLSLPSKPFDDLVNCIASDSLDCHLLAFATEKGFIYVFNFEKNQMVTCIKADRWIGSLLINKQKVLISNYAFVVCEYHIRSKALLNRVQPSTSEREGFGPKGVIFTELKTRGTVLFNSGYLNFKIYSIKTKKVLRVLNPFSNPSKIDKSEPTKRAGKMILNYNVNREKSILLIILKDDPYLYLQDLKQFKCLPSIKLYNAEELPKGMFLLNSLMVSHGCYCFIALQFLNPKASKPRIVSVLLIVKIEGHGPSISAKVLLYGKISRLGLTRNRRRTALHVAGGESL